MKTYRLPMITAREWQAIAPVIPRNQAGPPPRHDRQIVSAVCYAQLARCSFESLPPGYPKAMIDPYTRAAVGARRRVAADPRRRLAGDRAYARQLSGTH